MPNRRDFLKSLVAVAASTYLPMENVFAGTGELTARSDRLPWKNWSGSQISYPVNRLAPASVAELQEQVRNATGVIRAVGSGHSFSALVPTDDTLISLNRLSGILSHDDTRLQATIAAGTRLGQIGQPLEALNQALINMPDIDQQTLAGSLATATHGTGANLQCLSASIEALSLVTASGDQVRCSRDHNRELFDAARVGLGSLGVVTDVTLQNTRPYRLKRVSEWQPIEDILASAQDTADRHRNFEFFYIPFSGMGLFDTQEITDEPVSSTEKFDQNDGARDLQNIRDMLSWSTTLRQMVLKGILKSIDREVKVASSWQNYTSDRNVRFNEMEYHLPREDGLKALAEIRDVVENNFPEVFFPFEVRFVKGDDIWLSPFYQRDTISIAVHRFFEEDYQPLFQAVEPIFRKYGGRPHWGKLNTLNGQDFAALYPHWGDFKAVRQEMDPDGRFLNPYLQGLFTG
ncbi:D-arabinono-1,4-lactone oxidase [Marinobacter zhejiangensis]|uniref:FAD-linked oxidoreductase n=1 Tax=Marinobacter zhejiangensis TaxID=488535 RepID=A0A1I4LXG7_9GAMM|nr:D-arabinono-1,4-lactone oxidase [Marinobacter zhejiangensis]SFL95599.1 FAD-linked oxidoreductase [Marinobacter zhejiangensis]